MDMHWKAARCRSQTKVASDIAMDDRCDKGQRVVSLAIQCNAEEVVLNVVVVSTNAHAGPPFSFQISSHQSGLVARRQLINARVILADTSHIEAKFCENLFLISKGSRLAETMTYVVDISSSRCGEDKEIKSAKRQFVRLFV